MIRLHHLNYLMQMVLVMGHRFLVEKHADCIWKIEISEVNTGRDRGIYMRYNMTQGTIIATGSEYREFNCIDDVVKHIGRTLSNERKGTNA